MVDGVLLALVRAANSTTEALKDGEQGLGLVLVVGGATISGKLVSNWAWFKKVEENIRKSAPSHAGEPNGMAEIFSWFGDEMISMREDSTKITHVFDQLPTSAQQALADSDRTEFIHLEDARVYEPGYPGMPGNGMLWRGRLKDVCGWSLGLFEAQQ